MKLVLISSRNDNHVKSDLFTMGWLEFGVITKLNWTKEEIRGLKCSCWK